MPSAQDRFPDEVITDFSRWIERGADDPRDKPPAVAAQRWWVQVIEVIVLSDLVIY